MIVFCVTGCQSIEKELRTVLDLWAFGSNSGQAQHVLQTFLTEEDFFGLLFFVFF